MVKCIRLACYECDTTECEEIEQIPPTWNDVFEVQTLRESLAEVPASDNQLSVFAWYTHLGLCPSCQKEDT